MTAHSIYRVTCDAPGCAATGIIEKITEVPDGWRRVSSADHLADWKPGRRRSPSTGRLRADKRSRWDVQSGSFTLHLCPEHPTTFDAHIPSTEGAGLGRGDRARRITVTCSCGEFRASRTDVLWVSREPMPNHDPERAWWRHLPAGLQEYATRSRVVAGVDR